MADDVRETIDDATKELAHAERVLEQAGRLVSVSTAARRLQRCPATVRHWLKTGKIAGVKYPSGQYAVSSAAIEKILSQPVEAP